MKNPMFVGLWLCSGAALVLGCFKAARRQWGGGGLLFIIGVSAILMTVGLLRALHRLEIPVAEDPSVAEAGPIIMQVSRQAIGSTLSYAIGLLISAIALVQWPDVLWKKWLSYPAACLLTLLVAVLMLVVMGQELERVVADSHGLEVRTDTREGSIPDTKVAWDDVGAIKRVATYLRRSHGTDLFARRELVLFNRHGAELLRLEDPLDPRESYQQFLDSIPLWTRLTIQEERVTR